MTMVKKVITVIFLSILYIIVSDNISYSQWQTELRLTNDTARSSTSGNNAWCIAASGDIVHAVWYDERNGNWEIYYKRSTDLGQNWANDVRLTNDTASSAWPGIAVLSSSVFVVWQDERDGNPEIYFRRSTDNGVSWGMAKRLTIDTNNSEQPSLAVNPSGLFVVWEDDRNGNKEIYFKRSTDSGLSWSTDTRLTIDPSSSIRASVSTNGSVVHLVWQDRRDDNDWEIYYKRSTNGGTSWGADRRLTNRLLFSGYPCISVSNNLVHVTWSDTRDGDYEIYYKRSVDGGETWEPDKRLTNNTHEQILPSISSFGKNVHIAWQDDRAGNLEVYYNKSTDNGDSWESDTRLTSNAAHSYNPFVAVSGPVVHILWKDDRQSNDEIYYRRNPSGNPFGIKRISNELPSAFLLHQNYPNPFNPVTIIRFEVPENGFVNMKVCDALGREITELVNEVLSPGNYEVQFNAVNCTSGIYFYSITAEKFTDSKKMIIVK